MKEKIAKLIDVKSLVTLALTAVFAVLAVTGRMETDKFLDVFKLIMIFYFGTQAAKVVTKDGDTK